MILRKRIKWGIGLLGVLIPERYAFFRSDGNWSSSGYRKEAKWGKSKINNFQEGPFKSPTYSFQQPIVWWRIVVFHKYTGLVWNLCEFRWPCCCRKKGEKRLVAACDVCGTNNQMLQPPKQQQQPHLQTQRRTRRRIRNVDIQFEEALLLIEALEAGKRVSMANNGHN